MTLRRVVVVCLLSFEPRPAYSQLLSTKYQLIIQERNRNKLNSLPNHDECFFTESWSSLGYDSAMVRLLYIRFGHCAKIACSQIVMVRLNDTPAAGAHLPSEQKKNKICCSRSFLSSHFSVNIPPSNSSTYVRGEVFSVSYI